MSRCVTWVLVLTLVAVGCSSAATETSSPDTIAEFRNLLRQVPVDYEPHESPGALLREADVVVLGRIVAVEDGRDHIGSHATFEVEVVDLLKGDHSLVRDGVLYVEVRTTPWSTAEQLRPVLPPDRVVSSSMTART